ncbi:MAG TPA: electron transfer flavoprotein subunit alpha/FixB family protein [Bryobacteraceae bacterium]|nr:electron transfer flavoprotein subunit alpha/FixB family protein [Bryobacteraceae bacterium]
MHAFWVVAEHSNGAVDRVTFELLGEARRLARESGGKTAAVLFGDRLEALVPPLAHYGADTVYTFQDDRLARYNPGVVVASLGELCAAQEPTLVLFPATSTGNDAAVRLSMERNWVYAARCVNFLRKDGDIEMVRPVNGQKVHATVRGQLAGPRLATVIPDVIGLDKPDPKRTATVVACTPVIPEETDVEVRRFIPGDPATIDLREAGIIVSAGRGVGSRDNMQLVYEFAAAIGGSVGGTRVAVDLGWLPRERQIGQTGKTVTPRLYIACGISGATQHTLGMKDSSTIIAINTDPAAPIFKIADLALETDVRELLPTLTQRFRQETGRK